MATHTDTDFRTAFAQFTSDDTIANAKNAAASIRRAFDGFPATTVLYFAATDYDPDTLAAEMHAIVPGAVSIGASAAGEGVEDKLLNASVVAMAFGPDVFDHCQFCLVLDSTQPADPLQGIVHTADEGFARIAQGLGAQPIDLDYRTHVGFMLSDAISWFSESLLERIGEMTNVIFVGGFAGDDYKFQDQQFVFYNGQAYRHAAVLGLWKPKRGFELLKTQAVQMTEHVLTITKVDEEKRIIWEFDHRPAAQVYAECIGVAQVEMNIFDFDEYPLALVSDGEPYLRALIKPVEGGGLHVFAAVREGTRLVVTHAGDVLNTTKQALEQARERMDIRAIVHFNCASRHTILRNWGQVEWFAKLFTGIPSIALSSYGEIYAGVVALTSTMVLFK